MFDRPTNIGDWEEGEGRVGFGAFVVNILNNFRINQLTIYVYFLVGQNYSMSWECTFALEKFMFHFSYEYFVLQLRLLS